MHQGLSSQTIKENLIPPDVTPLSTFQQRLSERFVCVCSSDVLSLSRIRVCTRRIMTPLLLPTTPCWCLTTRAAAPQRAPLAPWTPPALENRTTTTSMTGVLASKSWQTSTEEGERTEGGNSRKTEGNGEGQEGQLASRMFYREVVRQASKWADYLSTKVPLHATEASRGEDIALQPALDLCCNPQVFYGFLQYFALWFLQCCFVTPLGPPRGSRWNRVATTNSRRAGIKKKKTSAHARFFVRFITKESSTHTFSLDLNFSRTEALLLIKCLLWCVLYRTPAISGSVAILKSFFCWAHTPPFLSAPLHYLLLSFHPCITGAERLFDYYVENKQRKCFVKTFVDKHRTHFPFRNLILPWEIGAYEVQWSNLKNLFFFLVFLFVCFFKLDRPRPYNVMLCNGCVKNQGLYFKRRKKYYWRMPFSSYSCLPCTILCCVSEL